MPYRGALTLEEKANSLLHADPLFPIQFFDTFKRRTFLEPERLLMLAVLQDAITCLEKYGAFRSGKNKRLFDEARDWILSDDYEWPFSFNNVCEAVGLNAGYLRNGLIRMSERKMARACIRTESRGRRAVRNSYVGRRSVWPAPKGYATHAGRQRS